MRNLKINAVIVTYNRKKMLAECLEAVKKQSYPVSKITLVDNASTDGTKEFLANNGYLNNPDIQYIRLKSNSGGAGGFYYGLKKFSQSNYDWAWIMDDDVIPQADSLEQLICKVEFLKKNCENKVSYLASSVYGENGEYMNVPALDISPSSNGYSGWYKYLPNGMVQIRKATFVSLLINKVAVSKVGLPCKDYFIWGDDSEYTQRLTKYFGPAFFVGNSKVIHKRKGAKNLSIENIDDVQRIRMYWRLMKNNFINTVYYDGKKAGLKRLLLDFCTSLKCLTKKRGSLKMWQYIKGDFLGIRDYKKIKNYIDNSIQNPKI